MATVNNSLQKAKPQDKAVTEYESNGEKIKLSPSIIKRYLVSGDPNAVTEQETMMFLMLCKSQHLNPFLREAYLIKYGNRNPASMVVGKDVFLKRARRQKDFSGFEAGIVVLDVNGNYMDRPGTFYDKEAETLCGGWAKVYVKGYDIPIYASVSFDEYAGKKADGSLNGQWARMPATMIRKVALCQALREAFPEDFGGLYSQEEMSEEEMSDVSGMTLDASAVDLPEEARPEPIPVDEPMTIEEMPNQADIAGALFND